MLIRGEPLEKAISEKVKIKQEELGDIIPIKIRQSKKKITFSVKIF